MRAMQVVHAKKYCAGVGCFRFPVYNYEGEPPSFCSHHKNPDMVPCLLMHGHAGPLVALRVAASPVPVALQPNL